MNSSSSLLMNGGNVLIANLQVPMVSNVPGVPIAAHPGGLQMATNLAQNAITKRAKCEHGRSRALCKDCGGSQICVHRRQKATCKECGGKSICPHGQIKSRCRECGGVSLCHHGTGSRRKSRCRECMDENSGGGAEFCAHRKLKGRCREGCGGSQICQHNKSKYFCKECKALGINGTLLCMHDKNKYLCKACGGSGICPHNRLKSKCLKCKKDGLVDVPVKLQPPMAMAMTMGMSQHLNIVHPPSMHMLVSQPVIIEAPPPMIMIPAVQISAFDPTNAPQQIHLGHVGEISAVDIGIESNDAANRNFARAETNNGH